MTMVTVRYWAAAKQAAGVAEDVVSAKTLSGALDAALSRRRGDRPARDTSDLAAVLARSSFLIDGNPVGRRAPDSVPLHEAAVIEVLPPFAGG
ncbi:MAG TPA: MoaD/ThiS family protein [Streptosporangiaceae bacterium]|jgi:molybdopterin converting factor small subunit|nr:MoaD/ThiS family protein [Streptosporangiaceae bacterium]